MAVSTLATTVFLAHSPRDKVDALQVKKRLADEGISVQTVDALPEKDLASEMRDAIAECEAFVVLATEAFVHSANLAFEIGAARAWQKPIYILAKDLSKAGLPKYLREFPVIPYAALERLAEQIHRQIAAKFDRATQSRESKK